MDTNATVPMDFKEPISLNEARVLLPLSVVTAVVNALVIITIWKDPFKQLKGTANYLILNLAVCDMLVGIPGEFLFALLHWVPGNPISYVAYKTMFCGLNASGLTILGLAVERLIVISYPLKRKDYLTSTYLAIVIVSIWFLAGLLTLIPDIDKNSIETYRLITSDAINIPMLILLSFCYGRIYFLVRKSGLHQGLSTEPECAERQCLTVNAQEIEKLKRRERSVAYSVFIIFGLYAACWMPTYVMQNVNEAFCHNCTSKDSFKEHYRHCDYITAILDYCEAASIFLHPLLNPIAYSLRTVKFRRALKRIILNCCGRESPRRAIV